MGTLLECRDAWKKVEHLKASDNARQSGSMLSPPEEPLEIREEVNAEANIPKKLSKGSTEKKAKTKTNAEVPRSGDLACRHSFNN